MVLLLLLMMIMVMMMKVAIKIIEKSQLDDENLKRVIQEIQVMKLLRHPNIIHLYQACYLDYTYYLFILAIVSTPCTISYTSLPSRHEWDNKAQKPALPVALKYQYKISTESRFMQCNNVTFMSTKKHSYKHFKHSAKSTSLIDI